MRVEVIDMEQTKKDAKKCILKKIPLVSRVFQFNNVISDIKLEYIEFKVLIYEIIKLVIKKAKKTTFADKHQQKRIKTIHGLVLNIIKYITIIIVFIL